MIDAQLSPSYIIGASQAEHARLVDLAEHDSAGVREMCAGAGIGMGARVIDVGCGPIGALVELADITGASGRVVGIDSSAQAVDTARTIVARHGLSTVQVLHGDIHAVHPATLSVDCPFDAAHMRLVLVHQPDPLLRLCRVAELVRPGGVLLLTECVADSCYPCFDPALPAHQAAWKTMFETARRRGAAIDAGLRLPHLCEAAGLQVVSASGSFRPIVDTQRELASTLTTLEMTGRAVIDLGVATEAEIDSLRDALRLANHRGHRGLVGRMIIRVIAQVP